MDLKIVTGIIAAVSALIGALIAAIAKGYSSRQKIQELKFQYETKLKDGYLENARGLTTEIYVPLSIALAKIGFSFQNFRSSKKADEKINGDFKDEINDFISVNKNLASRGANAYLTTDLDETLQGFVSFLMSSLESEEPNIKMVMKIGAFVNWGMPDVNIEKTLSGRKAQFLRSAPLSLRLGPVSFAYKAEEILAAPINSSEFEERFIRDTHLINILIKEVTLGAVARKNS